MLRGYRLRRAHSKFLASCRNVKEGRDYWAGFPAWKRWILETLVPVPLLSLLPDGKPLADGLAHLERDCRSQPLAEGLIRDYHRNVVPGSDGSYRPGAIEMIESTFRPPPPRMVPILMGRLAHVAADRQNAWDAAVPGSEEILRGAVEVYQELGEIHPFRDGNGRVARLAMNHLLRRYDQPYVILPPLSESAELMEALQEGHRGNLDPLLAIARAHRHRI